VLRLAWHLKGEDEDRGSGRARKRETELMEGVLRRRATSRPKPPKERSGVSLSDAIRDIRAAFDRVTAAS
jgi:hypothetical protein